MTTDSTTTCASGFLKDYISPLEASVVRQLRHNGYTVEGKTNMDEFGMGSHSTHSYFGSVSNMAAATHRSAGGSSGGSAMTVAMGARGFCPWYRYRGISETACCIYWGSRLQAILWQNLPFGCDTICQLPGHRWNLFFKMLKINTLRCGQSLTS